MISGLWTWHPIPQFLCPVLTQADCAMQGKCSKGGNNTLLLSIVWEIHITDLRYMLLHGDCDTVCLGLWFNDLLDVFSGSVCTVQQLLIQTQKEMHDDDDDC